MNPACARFLFAFISLLASLQPIVAQEPDTDVKRWSGRAFKSSYSDNLSDAEKAAGLSKLWAEAKFNFVNFHLVPELDWDAEYIKFMPKVLQSKSTLEYYRLLEQFVAKLKDGHTNVFLPTALASEFNSLPSITSRMIEGRVIIVRIQDASLGKLGIKIGQEVIEINGIPVKEYAKQNIIPYMSASTPQDLQTRTYEKNLFRGPLNKELQLKLLAADGQTITASVPRVSASPVWKYLRRPTPFAMKILDDNIAYVRLNSFSTNQAAKGFANTFEKIATTGGLILDLRDNGGGNSGVGWEILGYLTDKPFDIPKWHTLQYRPTYRAWGRQVLFPFGSSNKKFSRIAPQHYKKPVVMLVGSKTYSAAEDMAVVFDVMNRGKIIGQPTGGSTGQPLMLDLPGGGRARICTKHDSYPDGTEFVGVGIQPDRSVELKVDDFTNRIDRTLEVALQTLKEESVKQSGQ